MTFFDSPNLDTTLTRRDHLPPPHRDYAGRLISTSLTYIDEIIQPVKVPVFMIAHTPIGSMVYRDIIWDFCRFREVYHPRTYLFIVVDNQYATAYHLKKVLG